MGVSWSYLRVGQIRLRHGIPTACPIVPKGAGSRGDGLVPVAAVMEQAGISRSVVGFWCRCGFLPAQQKAPRDPRWIRWTDEDLARVDGTRAAHGYGRWRLREARRVFGLCEEDLYQRVHDGELMAYRAPIENHGEWRGDPADQTQQTPLPTLAIEAASKERE